MTVELSMRDRAVSLISMSCSKETTSGDGDEQGKDGENDDGSMKPEMIKKGGGATSRSSSSHYPYGKLTLLRSALVSSL